jgi:hypothetical protein
VVKAYLIKPKIATSAATDQPQQPPPVIVEFESIETRNSVVAAGKKLATSEHFKSVYIRPDRTQAEQVEFNRLYRERKEANDDLAKHDLLNKPYRFVIRGDKLRCINVEQTLDNSKHPFVQWKTACDARKGKHSQQQQQTNH